MGDRRVEDYARLLVERCLAVQADWQVLVATTVEALPLARAISRLFAERDAWCLQRITAGAPFPADLDWIESAVPERAGALAPLEQSVVDAADASIFVLAPAVGLQPGTPAAAAALRAYASTYRERQRRGEIPSVRCDFPCTAYAERARMTRRVRGALLPGLPARLGRGGARDEARARSPRRGFRGQDPGRRHGSAAQPQGSQGRDRRCAAERPRG